MSDYGKGIASASTAATETTAPVANTTAGLYSWSSDQDKVVIFNHPSSGVNLYVRWNDTNVTPDSTGGAWNAVIEPGGEYGSSRDILIANVAVYVDGAATYGTDYTIQGWN